MKLTKKDPQTRKEATVIILWGDHWPACPKCREVDISKTATLANACAVGAQLLGEELAKLQAPIVRAKAKAERAWAIKAGCFKVK